MDGDPWGVDLVDLVDLPGNRLEQRRVLILHNPPLCLPPELDSLVLAFNQGFVFNLLPKSMFSIRTNCEFERGVRVNV